jgi:CheY-like chemotaxis protein
MLRILCIEDDAETRVLIKKGLESLGMSVDTAWGGEKGVQAALTGRFDCVLLDLMMSGMDGFQVLHALKTQGLTRALPVILVTAREDQDSRRRAKTAGADGYVVKPFRLNELAQVIHAAVEHVNVQA